MIYILAPAYQVSGGPEALQQMCYYLRKIGKESIIVFYDYEKGRDPMPYRYKIYSNPWMLPDDIKDLKSNSVVVPERKPLLLNHIKNAKKIIWWLSKDNFIFEKASVWKRIKYAIKKFMHIDVISLDTRYCDFSLDQCTHLCGSKYAFDYVSKELNQDNVHYCVEPISLDFLLIGPYNNPDGRKDIVLYNPSKPSKIMSDLLQRSKFNYLPLIGYTPNQLAELFKSAKLYIDFGSFPGPERLPKEAVYFGCHILVGNRNAAINDFDVAIPEKYKLGTADGIMVENCIEEMLNRYSFQMEDFTPFCKKIMSLEETFKAQLQIL